MGSMPSIPVYHSLAGKVQSARHRVLVKLAKYHGSGREEVRSFYQIQRDFFPPHVRREDRGPVRERAAQSGNDGALGCQRNYFLSV